MRSNHQPTQNAAIREKFRHFARGASQFVGSPWMFIFACLIIIGWGVTGPMFHYSDTWQLIINTGTTIVTFLMVFLIQNTQNRDARAVHLKLDELIRAIKGARNTLVDLEEMSDEELDRLHEEFQRVCGARQGREQPKPRESPSSESANRSNAGSKIHPSHVTPPADERR